MGKIKNCSKPVEKLDRFKRYLRLPVSIFYKLMNFRNQKEAQPFEVVKCIGKMHGSGELAKHAILIFFGGFDGSGPNEKWFTNSGRMPLTEHKHSQYLRSQITKNSRYERHRGLQTLASYLFTYIYTHIYIYTHVWSDLV